MSSPGLPSAAASLALAAVVVTAPLTMAGSAPPSLSTLEPGGFRGVSQTLDVNIVFVGYEPGAGPIGIDQATFGRLLPERYRPIHRYPAFYGTREEMGLEFSFDYNVVFADAAFEDAFFTHLAGIATPAPLTSDDDTPANIAFEW